MKRDPFKIDGPTAISMSGGRTSAYMLWRVLQSNGGLPDEAQVMFANTGLEAEETLRFVRAIAEHWAVDVAWLEYRPRTEPARYARVAFETASRSGEPFEALIRERRFLPNPVTRFCTSELKIRTMHRFLRAERAWPEWDQFIGIRADEQRRVAKIRTRGTSTETVDETMCIPLADAGVTLQAVNAFWLSQRFNLQLDTNAAGRTTEGNCVHCFLKPPAQRLSIARKRPGSMVWYARMEAFAESISEKPAGARFNRYGEPSYAEMTRFAESQDEMFDQDEEALACFCGD